MIFEVHHYRDEDISDESGTVHIPGIDIWHWRMVKADGEILARSGATYPDEKTTRSNIAAVKKSMRAAGRCKVMTVEA